MNKQMWNLYKESDRGKKCIEMFNPEIENTSDGIKAILDFSEKWEDKIPVNGWLDWLSIYGDSEVGAKLNKLIGREVITRI